ncbi:hypothetical protein V493_01364 [Pseudogymnoascus sp. VKM F-4281 (FW-2241)]|nr:hypothetical protein V493_01364 [Pseudogymnoascus sp. VKM F-4281 (FW-2241)]
MRGLLATALLAPALASALVAPNTWDGVDIVSATHTEISHAVQLTIPLLTASAVDPVSSSSLGFEVDLARSGSECGSGDLLINGIPVPYSTSGALKLTEYLGLKSIQMEWTLNCGPLTRTLAFAVKNVNGQPVNDLGVTVLYSQDDTSLEILNIKKLSKHPKPVYLDLSSDEASYNGRLKTEDQNPEVAHAVPIGAQSPITEKPSTSEVDTIQGVALCDSAKCVFMVAVHNTKETAKHIKSKVKSIFCHGKPREPHQSKCSQSGRHGGKHHDEHDADKHHVRPGHGEVATNGCHDDDENKPHHSVHHGHHGHKGQWRHVSKAAHPGLIVFFFVFFAGLMFHIHRRICRAEREAARGASDCDDGDAPRRRRRCCGWRRRRCREMKREYSEKDEILPRTEPNPAYSSPSHIATEIADLRHAAEAVEDIVSQSSEGTRYARRGSADTMETLPEYTTDEAGSKMGSETLPGYADSEESVNVADGYQPGTGEIWRARVDGVNVKD